ncbi:hypothetical protein [Frondihabitans sp. VKM Ac-2883]|uniref:hypothetical protein n=1 Tax=Frondihabitans sp. VKM Ac-2883 TaxID=2783823 RepID=UPI00188C4E75|nr:hypothetical protein [Frondihabitans sp. VKM Ac-2883]MBF4577414.1 hypothetical protein [Frondihabitans sp. VKM Ac-2883]
MTTTTSTDAPSTTCPCPPSTEVLDSHRELRTRADLDERIRQLIPCATQRQLWLLLLDGDDVQMPVMVPIGDLPLWGGSDVKGGADGEGLIELLRSVSDEFHAVSYVFVLERPGSAALDSDDVSWLEHLLTCGDRAGFTVRAAYVCHESGHAGFEAGDIEALVPGAELPRYETRCVTCPVLATAEEARAEIAREETSRGEAVPAGASAGGSAVGSASTSALAGASSRASARASSQASKRASSQASKRASAQADVSDWSESERCW